jgi:hypothetical protein
LLPQLLRASTTSGRAYKGDTILLKTEMGAGHFSFSDRWV